MFQIVMNCLSKWKWSVWFFIETEVWKDTGLHRKAGGVQYTCYTFGKKDEGRGQTDETMSLKQWHRSPRVTGYSS